MPAMNETRNVADDEGLFSDSLAAGASPGGYLGDIAFVESDLRIYGAEALRIIGRGGSSALKSLAALASNVAAKYVGEDVPGVQPVPKWNTKDGGLSEWLGNRCRFKGSPAEIVAGVLVRMAGELAAVALGSENALDEQWQWELAEIYERYSQYLVGVDQVIIDVGSMPSPPGGVIEDDEEDMEAE